MLKKTPEPLPIQRVIELLDIGVEHPPHLVLHQPDCEGVQRIMGASPWAKPIGEPQEVALVYRAQHADHGVLDNLVLEARDASWALRPIRLGDIHAAKGLSPIASLVEAGMQRAQILPQIGFVAVPGDSINSCSRLTLKHIKALAQQLQSEMVEQGGELQMLIPLCCLTHTRQPTRRRPPALRPGCGRLEHVPLGQRPSLHPLPEAKLLLVRGFPRYYAVV